MESEISTAETGLELPLAEPHFDDEATVLSARPVVPLDEVESFAEPSRLTRGWVFAATVVGAMLLGVVVGVAYYSYANRQRQPSVGDETISAGVDGRVLVIEPAGKSDSVVSAPEVRATSETKDEINKPPADSPEISARESRQPVARRVDVITWPSSREERKAARRLAKQQRKEMEREGRDRNLTRIREIFEGPQRP